MQQSAPISRLNRCISFNSQYIMYLAIRYKPPLCILLQGLSQELNHLRVILTAAKDLYCQLGRYREESQNPRESASTTPVPC